jgi:hypothetical protein
MQTGGSDPSTAVASMVELGRQRTNNGHERVKMGLWMQPWNHLDIVDIRELRISWGPVASEGPIMFTSELGL